MKSKIKRTRKHIVFIGILKDRHNEYVEIIARTLLQAGFVIKKKYGEQVDFIYKAQRHSGSCLKKIETLTYTDYLNSSFPSIKGDENKD